MTWVLNLKSNLKGLSFQGGPQLFLKTRTAKREAEFSISASPTSSMPGNVKFWDCFHLPFNFPWKYPIHLLGRHVPHPLCKTWQVTSEIMWLIISPPAFPPRPSFTFTIYMHKPFHRGTTCFHWKLDHRFFVCFGVGFFFVLKWNDSLSPTPKPVC